MMGNGWFSGMVGFTDHAHSVPARNVVGKPTTPVHFPFPSRIFQNLPYCPGGAVFGKRTHPVGVNMGKYPKVPKSSQFSK